MAKLAYYASKIAPDKPHQLETPEGYRIYTAVPVCRSGIQEYLGQELKGHPDYDAKWNLADDDVVKVLRPREVVTAPETVASFEGKSVLDGHPPADVALVMVENEDEYGKGHMQNMRVGPEIAEGEGAGEITLLADLFVKDQPLNGKIDGGVRDVSCGYVYGLKRLDDGTFVMTRICGNHVAVVPKGRAGPEVSIRDEAIPTQLRPKPDTKKEHSMKDHFWGRLLKKLAATDAEPEDLEKVAKMAKDADEEEAAKEKAAKDKAAKDAEEKEKAEKEKAARDAEENGTELHPDLKKHIEDTKAALDAIAEHFGIGKEKKDEGVEEATGDADVLEMTTEEQGKTELPKQIAAADSLDALKAIRPMVVAAKDAAINKVFNEKLRTVKAAAAAADSAYSDFAVTGNPHEAQIEDIDPSSFFNGVSFQEGQRRFNEYKAQRAAKGGK